MLEKFPFSQEKFEDLDVKKCGAPCALLCASWMENTVKKLFDIPVPSRDVTYQTLPGRE